MKKTLIVLISLVVCSLIQGACSKSKSVNSVTPVSPAAYTHKWLLKIHVHSILGVAQAPVISNDPVNCILNLESTSNTGQWDCICGLQCSPYATQWHILSGTPNMLDLAGSVYKITSVTADSLILDTGYNGYNGTEDVYHLSWK
jgi:hypothetical protein